ncbi:MAG TPA: exosortase F system-associated protein [Xanthomarina sp.]|nr:exosortase F system-associated protein [Xanthomarina sp.]
MNKGFRYTAFIVLVGLLVLIRVFEAQLFYDPYLAFFKNDYLYIDSPRQEVFKLAAFTTLRYVLNSVISLGILFVLFKDLSIIKFSVLIYALAYVVFMSLFLYFVIHPKQEDYYLFFNVRRFLIQPLMALLLIPAFYYHKQRL